MISHTDDSRLSNKTVAQSKDKRLHNFGLEWLKYVNIYERYFVLSSSLDNLYERKGAFLGISLAEIV